jgi:hypothetical protein
MRIKHFSVALPRVDHIAFVSSNLRKIEERLVRGNVFFKRSGCLPAGIQQIFILDPDANVIEVSNCAPPEGNWRCPDSSIGNDDLLLTCEEEAGFHFSPDAVLDSSPTLESHHFMRQVYEDHNSTPSERLNSIDSQSASSL